MPPQPRRRLARLIAGVSLAAAACVQPAPRVPDGPILTLPDQLAVRVEGRVQRVSLEEYVLASVLSEVVPVGETAEVARRIFEVQAVIARSYAASNLGRHRAEGFDLCDETHCQLYQPARIRTSSFAGVASDAVRRTSGVVLVHSRRLVEALYHADCGGYTAAAEVVWGRRVPYLIGGPDDISGARHRSWSLELDSDRVRTALNGDPATAVGRSLRSIDVEARDESGRAVTVRLTGDQTRRVRGEVFRAVLNRVAPAPGLRSTRMAVALRGDTFRFDGTGFGHGVGLCQVGAAARARRGDETRSILAAYYPEADSRRLQ